MVNNVSGFRPSLDVVTTVPPSIMVAKLPSQTPVPCIKGQAGKLVGGSATLSRKSPSAAKFSGGSNSRAVAPMVSRNCAKGPTGYITPLGMPVVPPV